MSILFTCSVYNTNICFLIRKCLFKISFNIQHKTELAFKCMAVNLLKYYLRTCSKNIIIIFIQQLEVIQNHYELSESMLLMSYKRTTMHD
jgi:hypothetical protein